MRDRIHLIQCVCTCVGACLNLYSFHDLENASSDFEKKEKLKSQKLRNSEPS